MAADPDQPDPDAGLDPTDPRLPARPTPRYVAIHDQAAAELRPKAQVVVSYWKGLRDAGMPEYEAMELARDFQAWLLNGKPKRDPDDEDADTEDTELD